MTQAIAAELTAEGLWAAGFGTGAAPVWQAQGAHLDDLPALAEAQGASGAPVLVTGAGGARVSVPCLPLATPAPWEAPALPGAPGDIRLLAQPMLSQSSPPALSGGLEFRVAGFLDLNPKFDGVLCLPGAEATLWALISAEEVVSLSGFRSGALARAAGGAGLFIDEAPRFAEAAADTLNRPERLAARLAEASAARALGLQDDAATQDRVAGALVGAEMAASRAYWLGQNVAVVGEAGPARAYALVLEAQGLPVLRADLDTCRARGARRAVSQGL
ncbi:MAG: 2-dehydro-3-deoxygalactonokinase [Celeribacter sp.]|jgi:2-dehydro-3-deoxygalactonokinase